MENTSSLENFENQEMPKNNMAAAIVGTILGCCSPCCIGFILGIIAIVMATQVRKKFEAGDLSGAATSAKNAKLLAYIAIGIAVAYLIYTGLNWDNYMVQIEQVKEQIELMQNQ